MDAALPLSRHPLVGRDRELEVLRACLTQAIAGRGCLALVSGEAGIGKTALVQEIAREARGHGLHLLVGSSYDRSETPPYGPWIESFVYDRGTSDSDPFPHRPDLGGMSGQQAFFAQVHTFLNDLAEQRPLLLILEDLHWADRASLELLRFLGRSVRSLPCLMIVTYRANELTRLHPMAEFTPLLVRESPAERIDLRPLGVAAALELVRRRYGLPEDDAARLAAYLITRSEGNALFLTELLRTLEDERLLRHDQGRWHVEDIELAPVPLFLKQMIDARLFRLGDESAALLAVAAVIGHQVPLALWQTITQADEDALIALTERAEAVHIVTANEAGDGIGFAHALIRESLYSDVPALRRRRLHQRVAETLASLPVLDPDAVAYHFQQAGDDRAAEWLVRAGERARDAHALVAASHRYVSAFTLLDQRQVEPGERGWLRLLAAVLSHYQSAEPARQWVDEAVSLAAEAADSSLAARAVAMRGLLRSYAGELRQGIEDLARAADAIERLPPSSAHMRRREQQIDIVANRGTRIAFLAFTGHLAVARSEGERYLEGIQTESLAANPHMLGGIADAQNALSMLYTMQGDVAKANHLYQSTVDLYQTFGHQFLALSKQRERLSLVVIPYLADDLAQRERIAVAAEQAALQMIQSGARTDRDDALHARLPLMVLEGHWREARQIAETTDVWDVAKQILFSNFTLGPLARNQGDSAVAWRCVREAWPNGPDVEMGEKFVPYTVPLLLLGADLALDAGDLDDARRWLRAHQRWMSFMGATLGLSEEKAAEARWWIKSGDLKQARMHANRALEHASSPRQPLALLVAHRMLAQLDTMEGQFAAAADHLAVSLALADACAAHYERTLVLFARAELEAARGRVVEAATILDQIRATATSLDALPLLGQVQALADRLQQVRPVPERPAGLSAREVEVLRLVAAGLTNAQAAERLFISPRTVNAHLTSIYRKLDVPSRVAAIRFAIENDLT